MRSLIFIVMAAAFVAASSRGLSQPPPPSSTPQKPLRERLLERAKAGDAEAQFDLGKNYETGRAGLPKDFTQAEHWYREAAKQGEPFAAASLGILFNFGKGVQRDYLQAYVWYERSIARLTGADRDSVVELRDRVAKLLTPAQLAEGKRLLKQ